MNLIGKISEVMKNVKYIQKTGYNSFHRYNYATEADVNEKVREEFSRLNVIMIPDIKDVSIREHITNKGNREYITSVKIEFKIMDGDSEEIISFMGHGEGQDAGDKGIYKAITGAQKYALMKALMIPTGDDPEGDSKVDERNAPTKEAPIVDTTTDLIQRDKNSYYNARDLFYELSGKDSGFEEWFEKQASTKTNKEILNILEVKKEAKK